MADLVEGQHALEVDDEDDEVPVELGVGAEAVDDARLPEPPGPVEEDEAAVHGPVAQGRQLPLSPGELLGWHRALEHERRGLDLHLRQSVAESLRSSVGRSTGPGPPEERGPDLVELALDRLEVGLDGEHRVASASMTSSRASSRVSVSRAWACRMAEVPPLAPAPPRRAPRGAGRPASAPSADPLEAQLQPGRRRPGRAGAEVDGVVGARAPPGVVPLRAWRPGARGRPSHDLGQLPLPLPVRHGRRVTPTPGIMASHAAGGRSHEGGGDRAGLRRAPRRRPGGGGRVPGRRPRRRRRPDQGHRRRPLPRRGHRRGSARRRPRHRSLHAVD